MRFRLIMLLARGCYRLALRVRRDEWRSRARLEPAHGRVLDLTVTR